MQSSKLITIGVTAVVCVIVVAAVLIPVLEQSEDTGFSTRAQNDGYAERLSELSADSDITITFDRYSGFSLNGELYSQAIHIDTDACYISTSTSVYANSRMNVYSENIHNVSMTDGSAACTVTIRGGTIAYTGSATAWSVPFTVGYITDSDGLLCRASAAYVDRQAASGAIAESIWSSDTGYSALFTGTLEDGFTAAMSNYWNSETSQYSSVALSVAYDTEDAGAYADRISNVRILDGSGATAATGQIIVPIEWTTTTQLQDNARGLMSVIPVLIIVALVVGIAGLVLRSRD